jgi:hypothetical protein
MTDAGSIEHSAFVSDLNRQVRRCKTAALAAVELRKPARNPSRKPAILPWRLGVSALGVRMVGLGSLRVRRGAPRHGFVAAFEQRPNSTRPERQDIFGRSDLQTTPRMSRAELLPGGNTGFR